MPRPNRRHFSKAFKLGAIKLVTEQGYSINEAARRLEVDRKSMHDWIVQLAPSFDSATTDQALAEDPKAMAEQLRALRKEVAQLRMDNDILKKATAYFAKETP